MVSSTPRVSVVMAVYNGAAFLDETVASLRAQTFSDWELVAVDDGSTDATPALLEQWAGRDARIRVARQPNSGRPSVGRNHGIALARGDIISFLDADDLYAPGKLALQVEVLDALPHVGGVYHDYRWFQSGAPPETGIRWFEREGYLALAAPYFTRQTVGSTPVLVGTADLIKFMSTEQVGIHTSAIAVRRAVLDSLDQPPFNEALPHGEDIDLWIRISRQTILACIDQPLSAYRFHRQSWVTTLARATQDRGSFMVKSDMLQRLERSLTPEERPRYRERIAAYWYGIGYRSLVGGLIPQARLCFRNALVRTRKPRLALRAIKGLAVAALPRSVVRSWWRRTGGGEFEVKKGPA